MIIPKNLQEKRDELAELHHDKTNTRLGHYKKGFNSACNLLLPEIKKLEDAVGQISCDCYQTESDFIPCNRCEALQSWHEFLKGGESNG